MEVIQENSKTLHIGGSTAFDFMNTKYRFGDYIEILDSPTSLLHWMVGAKLLNQDDLKIIREKFCANDLNRLLADSLALREQMRNFTANFKEKGTEGISKEDMQYFNNIFRRGGSHLHAEINDKNSLKLTCIHEWNNVEEVLALIVESFIKTLSNENIELIKRCANPKCNLWFVDETKAHKRQWCSQAICGNRAKQAAFKKRQKEG